MKCSWSQKMLCLGGIQEEVVHGIIPGRMDPLKDVGRAGSTASQRDKSNNIIEDDKPRVLTRELIPASERR